MKLGGCLLTARVVTGMKVCASPVQALVRNVGTLSHDVKGELQVVDPQGAEYRSEAKGRTGP